jgi:tetratricopeptide (TPR) repeat protein
MMKSPKFWIPMIAFQVVFGLSIFTITRQYYIEERADSIAPTGTEQSSSAISGRVPSTNTSLTKLSTFKPAPTDPVEIARLATESFSSGQYARAADLYQQLLDLNPENVEIYNNLGITLHYLGNSVEALDKLNQGAKLDPSYHRIWLTLGYVNSQLGNLEQARSALETAVKMGKDDDIGRSAEQMLAELPPG